ncbi:ATP synthase F1 subunit gamma [Rickettsia endosymbiont of Ceutorhynchus obstrictus]|uniref:ATP synthase F1 subunit gamma n=1 Tax=Rickettsia endosymbiont of Ceutorhynchus obstrictus TaxID=3066249 RepID=UPI003132DA27
MSLKQLRSRVKSIKSTQKITKAMQLVSAAKLAKVKSQIVNSGYYVEAIQKMMTTILSGNNIYDLSEEDQKFFSNESQDKSRLLIVLTSERGLCGMFNSSIIKQVKTDIIDLENKGAQIKLIIIGKKGYEALKKKYANYIDSYFELSKTHDENLLFQIKQKIMEAVENSEISYCSVYFNKFKNAMTQIITKQQILPIEKYDKIEEEKAVNYIYEYEGENLIANMINLYVNSQINYALLQNMASEEGARMTAMENATNNSNDIIDKLTLKLNRSRQAIITNELIEIIAGADAV